MKKIHILSIIIVLSSIIFTQDDGAGTSVSGNLGSVTIDGKMYNQIALRPEIPIGKIGLGLDIYLYIDADGNIYKENWDFSSAEASYRTLLDKIYYLRYGQPNDNMYFRFGALPSATLGQGILVNNYSNIIEYPEVRRLGFDFKAHVSGIGIEFIQSDFKRVPGVMGMRISYNLLGNVDVGFSYISDLDQYKGMKDRDNDNYPDIFDDYPDDANFHDQVDYERNIYEEMYIEIHGTADGFENWFETTNTLPRNPSFDGFDSDPVSGMSVDLTYKINNKISLYSQIAKLIDDNGANVTDDKYFGMGIVPLGISAQYGPMKFRAEYRKTGDNFIFNYWDQAYDFDRIKYDVANEALITKESTLSQFKAMTGFYAEITANVYSFLSLNIGYQDMQGDNIDEDANKTLLGSVKINTSKIPKLKKAELFYQQSNISELFTDDAKLNTIHGYDLGFEISDGMMLVYKGRTSYIMNVDGEYETVNSVQFETQIIF
jgi:hypothetical protein